MSVATRGTDRATSAPHSQRLRRGFVDLLIMRVALVLLCLVVLIPAYWTFKASVQPGSSAYSTDVLPNAFTLDNYRTIINAGFVTWLRNSLIVCISAGLIQLLFNTLGAYAFSRLRFVGKRYGLLFLFVLQTFPSTAALSAIFALLIKINLLDTFPGIILAYIGSSAFGMWLIKNYMDTVPRELDESATVDGANAWQIFFVVILPLLRPMLVTMFLISFQGTFQEFILASFVLQSPDHYTVITGLFHLIDQQFSTNWAQFSAGAVLASAPVCILFLALQRQIVTGLASGAVKG